MARTRKRQMKPTPKKLMLLVYAHCPHCEHENHLARKYSKDIDEPLDGYCPPTNGNGSFTCVNCTMQFTLM